MYSQRVTKPDIAPKFMRNKNVFLSKAQEMTKCDSKETSFVLKTVLGKKSTFFFDKLQAVRSDL